ncbi:putative protein kinase TKL-Pl-6 family [Helianthus debilis subsp. tardiflorus]
MEPSKGYNHVQYRHAVQSDNSESASSSSQGFLNSTNVRPTEMKPALNYSIQTGEEFSFEFMWDRVNPRTPFVPYSTGDPSHTPGYFEPKGALGVYGSGTGSQIPMVNIVQRGSNRSIDNSLSMSSITRNNSSRASDNSLSKIKILCSFGGKILPRPRDGKLRYVGGDTRIIRVKRDISWQELWHKAIELYRETSSINQLDSENARVDVEEKDAPQSQHDPSQVKVSESMQFVDMVENIRKPNSEHEVDTGNVGLPSLDNLDISPLQIIRNDDLEELKELGSGTFGTVYHGKWRGTDVAIKRIKKSCFAGRSSEQERLTNEFWREADILSKLHHPNVVAFYGVVRDGPGGTLATVTEFMVDGSLRRVLLRKDRHLDHRKKLIIAMDAAFGMEYLHSKNIVHFDIKCDNLLVNMKDPSRPICKVGDFGLSKIKRNTLVSGGVRGTLPWMAPELLNGSSNKVSEKVDVFSFGIVLWEILTGEEPYANMHYGAIIGGIVNNTLRPPIPKDCDGEWRRLMEQCWAPNPMLRPSFTEITGRLRVMSQAKPKGAVAARHLS